MLLSGAMELPPSDREELALSLWDSLEAEAGINCVNDEEFLIETNKRRAELHNNTVQSISHAELKQQLGR